MKNTSFDIKKSFEESMEFQKKMIDGFETMMNADAADPGVSEKETVYEEDKLKVYRYKPTVKSTLKTPVLIVYALVNRETMMDLQENNSFIKNLLNDGIDVYIIDWGYPTLDDKYITLEDYIEGYIDTIVDLIREKNKVEKINLLGVCQGGTFSAMYAALHPDKIKNLITMVAPIDFEPNDALLFAWGKYLDIDKMVDAYYGLIPGDFMNNAFVTLKPISLNITKYLQLVDDFDNPEAIDNFLRMEKWIFDSPSQVGEALRQFVNDLYRDNKLVKGEMYIGDKKVDLKNITMPVLNIYAKNDHIVSPESSKNFEKYVGTKDVQTHEIPTGHIGMYVSSKSKRIVAPLVSQWLKDRK
ncbi:polyhydroxyalkanoate synthase [Anaerosphaera aminiphila DSM 21120]|uniref:Poly(3-hydroxyalkanoate) polymerase subunit PhaC n=1 Tax=Anaerosphaera aminiphila DSM 21120 TaxID=1120995 RepID=A0A1M5RVE3_9FIRM|nr:class III poly(R)-hydroxyalkanoic acid synthase subunit PhaC [Anaerosphaera aminiphila]SHH30287.1 polyhydroxyalkanoate synthase [Anaerosphaera aminiphila DSM 21120]